MMDEALVWIEAHPASAYWFQGMAIVLTGVCALIASLFAYKGARTQAETAIQLHEREKENERKASSVVLAAELITVLFNVQWFRGRLRLKDYDAITRFHAYTTTGLAAFDNDPKIIASLTSRTASNVVSIYRDYKNSAKFLVEEMKIVEGNITLQNQLAVKSTIDFNLILVRCIKVIDDIYTEAGMDDGGFLIRWIEEEDLALDFPFISNFKSASPDEWRSLIYKLSD